MKHYAELKQHYKRVLSVNLLAKGKQNEQKITEAYEAQIKLSNLDYLRYEYLDFHDVC